MKFSMTQIRKAMTLTVAIVPKENFQKLKPKKANQKKRKRKNNLMNARQCDDMPYCWKNPLDDSNCVDIYGRLKLFMV